MAWGTTPRPSTRRSTTVSTPTTYAELYDTLKGYLGTEGEFTVHHLRRVVADAIEKIERARNSDEGRYTHYDLVITWGSVRSENVGPTRWRVVDQYVPGDPDAELLYDQGVLPNYNGSLGRAWSAVAERGWEPVEDSFRDTTLLDECVGRVWRAITRDEWPPEREDRARIENARTGEGYMSYQFGGGRHDPEVRPGARIT